MRKIHVICVALGQLILTHCPNVSATPIGQIGLEMGWFPLDNEVRNHEKGAIWQSHLAAQKEGVDTAIIFSNHKTY